MSVTRSFSTGRGTVYAYSTFFYTVITTNGYEKFEKWTNKVDIFRNEMLLTPVNIWGVHWALIVVNFQKQIINYYDSNGCSLTKGMHVILKYFDMEMQNRKNQKLASGWEVKNVSGIPQQLNDSDCGMLHQVPGVPPTGKTAGTKVPIL